MGELSCEIIDNASDLWLPASLFAAGGAPQTLRHVLSVPSGYPAIRVYAVTECISGIPAAREVFGDSMQLLAVPRAGDRVHDPESYVLAAWTWGDETRWMDRHALIYHGEVPFADPHRWVFDCCAPCDGWDLYASSGMANDSDLVRRLHLRVAATVADVGGLTERINPQCTVPPFTDDKWDGAGWQSFPGQVHQRSSSPRCWRSKVISDLTLAADERCKMGPIRGGPWRSSLIFYAQGGWDVASWTGDPSYQVSEGWPGATWDAARSYNFSSQAGRHGAPLSLDDVMFEGWNRTENPVTATTLQMQAQWGG